ncbi:MAG TPA: TIR domain-containing protein [Rhizomicrobium sp.]|nr:TIR domain-containing protein [Rhizomicrobium sp.]
MKERFEGANGPQLIRALKPQAMVGHDQALAERLAQVGSVVSFAQGQDLIVQDGADNDLYFLVAGEVAILVKGAEVSTRKAGETVGEMAAIEPTLPRSATVRALETTVALKVSNAAFLDIAEAYPKMYQPLARDLAQRLYQRNDTIAEPNQFPKLFIISSSEALDLAHALREGLDGRVFSTVWDQGVFFAGGYPLEALEKQVGESDFAVAIAEPDDIVESRGSRAPTVRDNVLFELGLFMGKLSRHRSILVHPKMKDLKLPSDLQGLTLIPYTGAPGSLANPMAPVCEQVKATVDRLGVKVFGRP